MTLARRKRLGILLSRDGNVSFLFRYCHELYLEILHCKMIFETYHSMFYYFGLTQLLIFSYSFVKFYKSDEFLERCPLGSP